MKIIFLTLVPFLIDGNNFGKFHDIGVDTVSRTKNIGAGVRRSKDAAQS